jgi:hypothetical protein
MTTTEARRDTSFLLGAYGLTFEGSLVEMDVEQELFVAAAPEWPRWEVRWEDLGHADPAYSGVVDMTWSPDRSTLPSRPRGYVSIDRLANRTTLHLPERPSAAALVHPYLASTGMIAGHWMGRAPFHAGAFELEGRAWGVLGGREMGKSSLLMALNRSGALVLTDDLLVLSETRAYAGPRCLDLRKGAAEHFGAGEYLGVVGARERWRVRLPAAPPLAPYAGWIVNIHAPG